MATYFHGNQEIQVGQDGGFQTMVLMNPTTYVQYNSISDQNPPPPPQPTNNLLLINPSPAAPAGNLLSSPHAPPLPTNNHPTAHQFDNNVSVLHGFIPRVHYNLYGTPSDASHQARDNPRNQQALSLSLSSGRQTNPPGSGPVSSVSVQLSNVVASGMQGLVLSSKYLKAAQDLLDEVVSVDTTGILKDKLKSELPKKSGDDNKLNRESSDGDGGEKDGGRDGPELTPPERQEIQMKKAKLISMLDEVDQRYRQYHQQMQIIILSFEQAAGPGSAKTYTSLALKTISKQFRTLKDAISAQIRAANKSLGEEDGKCEGLGSSRLKFIDHHLRQQRTLQQLGMIQHNNNAWRPQRGLPERAVSVLRAWLFEHFLHPYPKDSDKILLAKQTGLTRSQVSNWFINARVRLWKPMVEEMYLEEMKEQEKNNNGSEEKPSKTEQKTEDSTSKSIGYNIHQDENALSEDPQNSFMSKQDGFLNTSTMQSQTEGNFRQFWSGSSELEGITQGSPKKPRSNIEMMIQSPISVPSMNMDVNKVGEVKNNENICTNFIENDTNFIGGFGQYTMGETGRFEAEPFTPRYSGNNGVSLTLGLPHCENFSVSGTYQNFFPNQNVQLGRRVEIDQSDSFGAINDQVPHSSAGYETISIQNQRRFAAQLLPDFVS